MPSPSLSTPPPRRMPAGRAAAPQRQVAIWPIVAVIYATLLPREVCLHIGDNYLYIDRIILIITLPWMMVHILRGAIKFVAPDWLILIMGIWMYVAISVTEGVERGFISGVSFSFDAIAGYYLARISFRSLDSMRRALILCAPGFFIAGALLMMESLSHVIFVRPFFASIFGELKLTGGVDIVNTHIRDYTRLGLLRGYSVWVHPIEASLHLATLLGIYWMSGIRGWPRWLAVAAAFLSVFALSSAGLLALFGITAAIFYDWLTRHVRELTWPLMVAALLALSLIVEVTSNSGLIGVLLRYATLDSGTGWFRISIWQYASISVWQHPWFGIGFSPYKRPAWMLTSSIDTHWLLLAVRYGIIVSIALLAACILAVFALVRAEGHASPADARFYRGIAMSLTALIIMGFTVSFQGGTLTWFTMLLGGCVACAQHGYGWRARAAHRGLAGAGRGAVRAPAV